jgi:hypothetical protein
MLLVFLRTVAHPYPALTSLTAKSAVSPKNFTQPREINLATVLRSVWIPLFSTLNLAVAAQNEPEVQSPKSSVSKMAQYVGEITSKSYDVRGVPYQQLGHSFIAARNDGDWSIDLTNSAPLLAGKQHFPLEFHYARVGEDLFELMRVAPEKAEVGIAVEAVGKVSRTREYPPPVECPQAAILWLSLFAISEEQAVGVLTNVFSGHQEFTFLGTKSDSGHGFSTITLTGRRLGSEDADSSRYQLFQLEQGPNGEFGATSFNRLGADQPFRATTISFKILKADAGSDFNPLIAPPRLKETARIQDLRFPDAKGHNKTYYYSTHHKWLSSAAEALTVDFIRPTPGRSQRPPLELWKSVGMLLVILAPPGLYYVLKHARK